MSDPVDVDSEKVSANYDNIHSDLKPLGETDTSLVALIRRVLVASNLPHPERRGQVEVAGIESVRRIGKFEVRGEIGRGAFGTVLLVFDPDLGRERALKVPNPETLGSPLALSRFLEEARLASRVDHPNVVRVYEAETIGALPYIVMEYCGGGSLGQWLSRRSKLEQLPERWVAAFVAEIAEGVHQAHLAGLLHRDIKPGNILLEQMNRGSTHGLPCFRPKIADFGLAKVFEQGVPGRSSTASGTPIGTWAYMSPEQSRGDKRILATTDVYAIGAILYELLTGERLFANLTQPEILSRLLGPEEAPSPKTIRRNLHRDLETICAKCLEKKSRDRYQNVDELINDLRRYLVGMPILARPAPIWKHGVAKVKQRPLLSALAIVATLLILMSLGWLARLRNDRARELINDVLEARVEQVPDIIARLDSYRSEARYLLRNTIQSEPSGSPRSARAALVLIRDDQELVKILFARLLVCDTREHLVIRNALQCLQPTEAKSTARRFWTLFEDKSADSGTLLRAACILASFDPESSNWTRIGKRVALTLVEQKGQGLEVAEWTKFLLPVGGYLEDHLRNIMADRAYPRISLAASWAMAELLANRPIDLSNLILEADENQLRPLATKLIIDPAALAILQDALTRPSLSKESPLLSRDRFAQRRTNAAAVLARFGPQKVDWREIEFVDDPSSRTYLIERLSPAGVSPIDLLDSLSGSTAALSQAFILALGEYAESEFSISQRAEAARRLLAIYETEPDAGVHFGIDWLLRRWGKDRELDAVKNALRSRTAAHQMRWQHEGEAHAMSIIRGPTTFSLFTSTDFTDPNARKERVMTSIPYTYGISTCEVSVGQFKRFLSDARISTERLDRYLMGRRFVDVIGSQDDVPVDRVSFYAAAHYCLWLSQQAGIPQDQWCYERLDESPFGRVRPYPKYLERTGYRIPTYEEWMYGMTTQSKSQYYFGHLTEKINLFEWLAEDSGGRPRPVGLRRPNSLGLHDMIGNLAEWCSPPQSWNQKSRPLLMGSNFGVNAARIRDWKIGGIDPDYPQERASFRIARTISFGLMERKNHPTTSQQPSSPESPDSNIMTLEM